MTDSRPNGTDAGATIWLTGLPSSGKSTIARHAAKRLEGDGHRVEILDGDEIRSRFGARGFTRADRDLNVRQIGWAAELLARHGVKVLVPVIAPYAESRLAVREQHELAGVRFLEVHVAAPVEICSRRDVKGLYALQRSGQLTGLTGVDDPYESPESPELCLRTEAFEIDETVDQLMAMLSFRGLV
ncbi:adenylyl-sulfate kinase [Kribbella sp. NPDC051718]|uniref:adenylyl-sulfate kinase n=1 Tax=Kribbella sp. NPDC051718 TaxID=3155168 RepID=UPI0034305026